MAESTDVRTEKGISLARGPALVLGTILLAAGLYFLYKQHFFPPLKNFPNGHAPVQGKVFLGIFGANGWTGMLTAVAGGLLLFGAAQHLLAKTMSLLVGVALGAAAIIALASGNVLGLAAANHWTEIGWGVVAAILLFNTVIPRRRRAIETPDTETRGAETRGAETRAAETRPAEAAGVETPAAGTPGVQTPPQARHEDYHDAPVGHADDGVVPATEREAELAPAGSEPDAEGSAAATVRHDPER